jgi:hypothetical protein
MNNIIIEFSNILKHEEIISKDKYKFLSNEILNFISKRNDILLIINAEYDAPTCECVINYYNQYWGNTDFNNLLEKFKLRYEWYDTCTIFIYNDNDDND